MLVRQTQISTPATNLAQPTIGSHQQNYLVQKFDTIKYGKANKSSGEIEEPRWRDISKKKKTQKWVAMMSVVILYYNDRWPTAETSLCTGMSAATLNYNQRLYISS